MIQVALIHGWGHTIYTSSGCKNAWDGRNAFIEKLSENFKIVTPNLPGFCGQSEPNKPWDIENFSDYFEEYINKIDFHPDFVLGYSFGAPVALTWKLKFKNPAKLILIAPAISRAYKKGSFIQRLFILKKIFPEKVVEFVRSVYLSSIRNQFYTKGTPFLKKTYLKIVKQDLSDKLILLDPKDVLIIFGSNDTATPANNLLDRLENQSKQYNIQIIDGGGHDIANTHYNEIVTLILKFANNEIDALRPENRLG